MSSIIILISMGIIAAQLGARASPVAAPNKTPMILEVFVLNLGEGDGPVRVSIDNEASWFVDDSAPLRTYTVELSKEGAALRIVDLPSGDYALRVYHDEDGDGELKRGAFGIPDEPYGFSGLKTNRQRPKSFEEAKFVFDTTMQLTITLR